MPGKRDKSDTVKYSNEAHRRFAEFEPKFCGGGDPSGQRREAIRDLLPAGSSFTSRTSNMFLGGPVPEGSSLYSGAGSAQYHMQRPYMPEYSADKAQYPQDRRRANFYWRFFHKYDPIIGTAIDMYSEMLVSSFDITVPDDDSSEIKDTLEYMVETVNFLDRLKYLVKEYLVLGEVLPHLFWSDDEGIWTYIGFHNPDDVEIKDAPIINMDPIISYIPDDGLRTLLTDGTPESQEFRKRLPPEFVAKVMSRQKIRLSPLNCSFVSRKLHPYDMRGTSLLSRLWRINMVEDAVYDATIATYRRIAGPIRVVKLGDAAQGWLPNPEQESRLLDLLARAESDPASILVWNYGIQFESWGSADRVITIDKQQDVIERIKLIGLGLSKAFLVGEASLASVKGSLQVFLRRLLSLRQFLESIWIYPKFFRPVSQMNDWKKAKPSETQHRYRVKRTAQELQEQNLYIMPELLWHNKLDSKLDQDLLNAYKIVESLGGKISQGKVFAAVGEDWKDELESSLKEFKDGEELKTTVLGEKYKEKYETKTGPKPPGGAGGGALPPSAGGAAPKKPVDKAGPGGADKAVPLNDALEAPGEGAMPTAVGG